MGANLVIGFSCAIHVTKMECRKLQMTIPDVMDGSPPPASQCAKLQLRSLAANVALWLDPAVLNRGSPRQDNS